MLGLVAQDSQERVPGENISEGELADAQMSKMAQEESKSLQAAEGNLWAQDGPAAESDAAGTDRGVMPEYVGAGGQGVSNMMLRYQMTKLRLTRYVEKVLKVPVWFVGMLTAGSLLCTAWMIVCHVRLERYLRRRRLALSEAETEQIGELSAGKEKEKAAIWPGEGDEAGSPRKGRGLFRLYAVEGLPTPCLLGRSIYIPANLAKDREALPYILRHERCHYFHGDTLWGIVRLLCVCLYWYHPLVWLAAYLSRQDCELACDETVVKSMAGQERKQYGELLLRLVPVKGFPADCFSMTTAMSGSAKNLRQRLERITGKRKDTVILGTLVAAAVTLGIYACVTSGFTSADKQWQSIRIRREEGSVPVLQESYRLNYRLSRDAASYGLYLEQYEYGELTSAEVLDCATLQKEGEAERRRKKGEILYSRSLESDAATGAFMKSVNSYSVPDYTTSDGPGSLFRAFTLDLSEATAIGNSFSMAGGEQLEHRFRLGEDIVLLASYYGDGRLYLPPGHIFEAEKYMEETGEIWKDDSCVILVHLIVSDRPAEELRRQIDGIVREKGGEETGHDMTGGISEAEASGGSRPDGYSNEELLKMAENFYRREHGFTPSHVEIDSENGDEVLIWLYDNDQFLNGENEIVGSAHMGDWYTVNRMTGKGENTLLEEIDLTQTASR